MLLLHILSKIKCSIDNILIYFFLFLIIYYIYIYFDCTNIDFFLKNLYLNINTSYIRMDSLKLFFQRFIFTIGYIRMWYLTLLIRTTLTYHHWLYFHENCLSFWLFFLVYHLPCLEMIARIQFIFHINY